MTGKRDAGEGTFTQRGDRWRCQLLVNGRRVSGTGRTRTAARNAARERARLLAERSGPDTLRAAFDAWAAVPAAEHGLRPTTRDQYRTLVAAHVIPVLGDVRLDRMTKRQVADAFDSMGGSASSRRSTYAALVKVLDHAVGRGLVAVNVAREVPRPRAVEPRDRAVAAEGARKVLRAAAGHRYEAAAWLAFGCGLRRGEVLGLRWSDLDLDAGVLRVTGAVTRSSAGLVRGATKTRRGVRQVPVPPEVVAVLKAHRKAQAAERLASPAWQDSGLVLVNEAGGMVEPRTLSRVWQAWAKAAGLSDTGTHAGRHYAASTLLASGQASVADVAAQLGHDPAVLLNVYAVAAAVGQRAAAGALGASLIETGHGATDGATPPENVRTTGDAQGR